MTMSLQVPSISSVIEKLDDEQKAEFQRVFELAIVRSLLIDLKSLQTALEELQLVFDEIWSQIDDSNKQRFRIFLTNAIVEAMALKTRLTNEIEIWPSSKRLNLDHLNG
ncbi:MAG: hypothetical protein ABL888_07365 [Pirellulaceae bacterium]